ncbi:hypothetical protein LSTR_LSTR006508 [Laodelphax striatellus]|uniref:Uncharacterized protein n=1 Tax=Laodelphax striatellus TaxID=195883 RepID=A0A482WWY3_LAOST|nr:hypothetical protein LSTR_LSTR006508 [Laodelphax striatellus]
MWLKKRRQANALWKQGEWVMELMAQPMLLAEATASSGTFDRVTNNRFNGHFSQPVRLGLPSFRNSGLWNQSLSNWMLGGPAISRKRALLNLVIGDLELAFEDLKEWIEAVTTQELWTGDVIREVSFLADMEVEPGDQPRQPPHGAATAANQASATPTPSTSSRCDRPAAAPFDRSRIVYKPFNKPGVAKKQGGRPRFKVMGPDGKWKWQRSKQP